MDRLLGQESIVALGDTQTDRYWQHLRGVVPAFNTEFFNDAWLQETGAVVGMAAAGRGNTQILSIDGKDLVLRHYKRGGYVSKVSEDRYLWTGLDSARPFNELSFLVHLYELELPVPRPYGAEVVRSGASYSGSLLTYRVPGLTLAESFIQNKMTPDLWHQLGLTIALFHKHGICHADLNAHNILMSVDSETDTDTDTETSATDVEQSDTDPEDKIRVLVLDFDRASFKDPKQSDWQHKILSRLQRSLLKIADKYQSGLLEIAWQTVLDGFHGKPRV